MASVCAVQWKAMRRRIISVMSRHSGTGIQKYESFCRDVWRCSAEWGVKPKILGIGGGLGVRGVVGLALTGVMMMRIRPAVVPGQP